MVLYYKYRYWLADGYVPCFYLLKIYTAVFNWLDRNALLCLTIVLVDHHIVLVDHHIVLVDHRADYRIRPIIFTWGQNVAKYVEMSNV
jgi:hypothetical protein